MSLEKDILRFERWSRNPTAANPRGRSGTIKAEEHNRRAEKERLEVQPLSALGRRILVRQALTTRTGDVGVAALASALGVEELTILRVLKTDDALWYERKTNIDLAAKICQLLKVDHSWLFHTIDYGDLGAVSFDLLRAQRWHIRESKADRRKREVQCSGMH